MFSISSASILTKYLRDKFCGPHKVGTRTKSEVQPAHTAVKDGLQEDKSIVPLVDLSAQLGDDIQQISLEYFEELV